MKFRRDRRYGMKRENPLLFYPRYGVETVAKLWGYWRVYRQFQAMLDEALAAPDRWTYSDLAIAPPQADEFEALSLYHATNGGEAALARKRRDDTIRAAATRTTHRTRRPSDADATARRGDRLKRKGRPRGGLAVSCAEIRTGPIPRPAAPPAARHAALLGRGGLGRLRRFLLALVEDELVALGRNLAQRSSSWRRCRPGSGGRR